jgi:hypothetical protein
MITISRASKWVVYPGQRVCVEERNKLPHFTILPCFNPDGEGPRLMLVVPGPLCAKQVFAEWSRLCLMTTSPSGWVDKVTWMEWTESFCEWLEEYRLRNGALDQSAVLFLDSASTRGSVQALDVFRLHNVVVTTFPPHMTHVLQPVDAAWARSFKSDFVLRFRAWSRPDLQAELEMKLSSSRGVSQTMMRRGQVVAAAVESATHATRRSNCVMAFAVTGLADERGLFSPSRPLSSPYVSESAAHPEMDQRIRNPGRMFITSRGLTSHACMQALRARDAA